MQRLFAINKVPVFLDHYAPGVEKRRGEEVSILTLTLRVQPFDAQLAASLDAGVGGDSNVRPVVFSLSTTEPRPHVQRVEFQLGLAPQRLEIYASVDTEEARLAIDQVQIQKPCYVRTQKDVDALAFVCKGSFGPVGRDELEYVHAWFRGQRAVTFEAADLSIEFEEGDSPGRNIAARRRAAMFETDETGRVVG